MTANWYSDNAIAYMARTIDLGNYPGLEADLSDFVARLAPGSRIVDLGSGSGRDAVYMASTGFRVVAMDLSYQLLRLCLAHSKSFAGDPHVSGLVADMRQLPFRANSVDAIWACASILHLERHEIPECLTACAQMLREGGWLGLSMKEGSNFERRGGRLFTYAKAEELGKWLDDAGFSVSEIRGPHRGDWLLAYAKKVE